MNGPWGSLNIVGMEKASVLNLCVITDLVCMLLKYMYLLFGYKYSFIFSDKGEELDKNIKLYLVGLFHS